MQEVNETEIKDEESTEELESEGEVVEEPSAE